MSRIRILALGLLICLMAGCAAASGEAPIVTAEPAMPPVDLDLSGLSGTVVYAQVFNMTMDPDAYIGKVIRLSGWYSVYEDEERGVVYHACVIPDATACCAQGIEFLWRGEHLWPDDYPEPGEDIMVTGRLTTYEEDGYQYLLLTDASLAWVLDGEG